MSKKIKTKRLPRNFHKTFKPERLYINSMLRFAASGQSGNAQEIASLTGIPMGESSGKVPAILDYCIGMGLISLDLPEQRSSVKMPILTEFGRVVLLEDPFLKSAVSQWIAHFNLCNPMTGAEIWYQTFFASVQSLGLTFKREQLEDYLKMIYGTDKSGIIGPVVGMYEDEASFKLCGALSESGGLINRKSSPISEEFGRGYGAWLLQMVSDYFPNRQQVSVIDLNRIAGFRTIPAWTISEFIQILELLERKALILVDRHMDPWLIQPKKTASQAWRDIYLDMI